MKTKQFQRLKGNAPNHLQLMEILFMVLDQNDVWGSIRTLLQNWIILHVMSVQSDDQQVIQVDQKLSWISLTGILLFVMDETPMIM